MKNLLKRSLLIAFCGVIGTSSSYSSTESHLTIGSQERHDQRIDQIHADVIDHIGRYAFERSTISNIEAKVIQSAEEYAFARVGHIDTFQIGTFLNVGIRAFEHGHFGRIAIGGMQVPENCFAYANADVLIFGPYVDFSKAKYGCEHMGAKHIGFSADIKDIHPECFKYFNTSTLHSLTLYLSSLDEDALMRAEETLRNGGLGHKEPPTNLKVLNIGFTPSVYEEEVDIKTSIDGIIASKFQKTGLFTKVTNINVFLGEGSTPSESETIYGCVVQYRLNAVYKEEFEQWASADACKEANVHMEKKAESSAGSTEEHVDTDCEEEEEEFEGLTDPEDYI